MATETPNTNVSFDAKAFWPCDECGAIYLKDRLQQVESSFSTLMFSKQYSYYCPTHKKPYERADHTSDKSKYFSTIEVDINGNSISNPPIVGKKK